jgi:hypothetical protein
MRRVVWLFAMCWLCAAGLSGFSAVAFGEDTSASGGFGGSPLQSSLVVPAVQPLDERQQAQAAEQVKLTNPDTIAMREESRTKFENLNTEQAMTIADEAFPAVINEPAGGPPRLWPGESITSYISDNAASLDLGEGKHGVLESLAPVAVQAGPGQRVPVDLGLSEAAGAFEPRTPAVPVSIPKQLGNGVSLSGVDVSLTQVDEHGAALEGSEGAVYGAGVFYANTQTDTDTLAKPTIGGFELDSVLRSVASPERLYFRVGMPAGARLVQESSGSVNVVDEGAALARILVPTVRDAEGNPVGLSMTVAGNVLTLSVDDASGEHAWPILVDPVDEQLTGKTKPTNWKFGPPGAPHFTSSGWGGSELLLESTGEYKVGETGFLGYQTQGDSKIYEAEVESSGSDQGSIETYVTLVNTSKVEDPGFVARGSYATAGYGVCASWESTGQPDCNTPAGKYPSEYGAEGNWVHFGQAALEAGSGSNVDHVYKAGVDIMQEHGPEEPTFNTGEEHLKNDANRLNVLYGPGSWLSPTQGAFEVHDKDPGIGLSYFHVDIAGSWSLTHEYFEEGKCSGVQCFPEINEPITYNGSMPDGEDDVEAVAKDLAVGYGLTGQAKVKVDGTPPHESVLSGLPSSGVINEAQYHLQAQATDGSGKTPSSGVKSIALYVDGYEVPGKSGSCARGSCTAVGEWTINGETFGAGKHTLTVQAIDNAGNVENKAYPVSVRHAGSLGVGPGSVDPITGALHLSASDVSLSGGRGTLDFSRSYDSRQLKAGEQGPLGPQWTSSISGSQRVEQEPSGSVVLVGSDGGLTTFESNGKGGYISPKGDENLVLEGEREGEKVKAYLLKDPAAGTTVRYTQPGGAGPWVIASSEGELSSSDGEKETVEWERIESVTRPKLALAPAPRGVTCSPAVIEPKELSKGCRALSFTYATETTATGEAPSEWKAYKSRLIKVSFTAYNPSTRAMETTAVAEYAYDKQGRLRAEWDPRIEPSPLKTTYGYDAEGHVVAVNPSGQEPWIFHYGTTTSDVSMGRLLSVTRPGAGTSAGVKEQDEQAAPEHPFGGPTLSSTSPVVGTTLSINFNGTFWNHNPLAHSYAWEDCYTYESKETCTAIPGADNSTYTPQARDAGYTLKGRVTAVNSDGATVATTAASKALAGVAPADQGQFGKVGEGEGQFKGPAGDAIVDSSGNVWVVDHGNDRVEEWSATGTWMHTYGKKGTGKVQFDSPEGIAVNQSTGNVYIADKGNNRIEELNSKGEYVGTFGEKGSEPGYLSSPVAVAIAPNGNVWVADYGNSRVDEFTELGGYLGSFGREGSENGQFKGPTGIAFSGEDAYVVDSGNDRVQELSMSGQYISRFGSKGTSEGQFETPYGIATEPVSGDLYVADAGNNRIEEYNPAGTYLVAYGKKGEKEGEFVGPQAVVVNLTGYVYVTDSGNNRVQELEPKYSKNEPLPEPPVLGSSAVTTIDYNVPLWGEGAPDTTAKNEAEERAEREKWGQVDDPAEPVPGESLATAVFPPDEPMGWPAKDYKRATITYLDELGRTVNRASPSGGISTSEYNETDEVVRSLSADNRVAALKEGSFSKEFSRLYDTESRYNGETKEEKEQEEKEQKETGRPVEPGTRLLEVRGPRHVVKLSSGSEVKARNHVKYYYDESALKAKRMIWSRRPPTAPNTKAKKPTCVRPRRPTLAKEALVGCCASRRRSRPTRLA